MAVKRKPPLPAKQWGFKTKKGTNATANPSYVLRKFFFSHLLYIVYQIFRRAQIFVGFFRSRGRLCTAGGFSRAEFLQKNKPCKACTAKGRSVEKPLLPRIKYSTKYVKLQELNYIYSISCFSPNATAKPQNLPAVHYLGDVCIHTTKAYLQSTVASRVIVVRGLVNPPRLIRFREYRRGFQTPHELSFMPATLGRSGFLTTDTAQTQ